MKEAPIIGRTYRSSKGRTLVRVEKVETESVFATVLEGRHERNVGQLQRWSRAGFQTHFSLEDR